jgi:hypothetical protein
VHTTGSEEDREGRVHDPSSLSARAAGRQPRAYG